jgi:hypothetical protein
VNIFSGQPNPRWTLGSSWAEDLVGLIQDLRVEPNSTATEGEQLGFRGFTVSELDVPGLGEHDHLTVLPESG